MKDQIKKEIPSFTVKKVVTVEEFVKKRRWPNAITS